MHVNASGRGPQITAEEAGELERARERMLSRHKLIEAMIRNNEMQLKNESARGGAEIELECARRDIAQGDAGARFQQIEQYGVQAAIHSNWFDWVEYQGDPHGWYHWRPQTVREALTIMSDMFDNFVLGEQHDVKALAKEQRKGAVPVRNPDIQLWNALEYGRTGP
jgi:hypothetical protein